MSWNSHYIVHGGLWFNLDGGYKTSTDSSN